MTICDVTYWTLCTKYTIFCCKVYCRICGRSGKITQLYIESEILPSGSSNAQQNKENCVHITLAFHCINIHKTELNTGNKRVLDYERTWGYYNVHTRLQVYKDTRFVLLSMRCFMSQMPQMPQISQNAFWKTFIKPYQTK